MKRWRVAALACATVLMACPLAPLATVTLDLGEGEPQTFVDVDAEQTKLTLTATNGRVIVLTYLPFAGARLVATPVVPSR